MRYLQKLGKALMLPVACLPICGLLMGIGYLLCPATMQGGDIKGTIPLVGLFLVKAGSALIDNIALLFVVGVGVGMSNKNDGTGGVAALASWLMITTLLSTGFVSTIMPSVVDDPNRMLAFEKVANPFIGIIAGIIGSESFNRFKNTKLPDWLSFFSGKRCVAIFAGLISIVVSVVLLFVWPLIFGGLIALGEGVVGMGAVGAGIYAFLNRLLIPVGLHHALNNVFWFDTIGLGDLTHFWAGETSADVTWSLGMYMSGFFPCMMFGVPGAALAMIRSSKNNAKRKVAAGLLISAAICSFVCGVTEPFEFCFMFLAPLLYVVYAFLFGVFTFITVLCGFRAGFCFSGGATDLLFSSTLPAAEKTWMIIPLGLAAFVVFYAVFRFAITRFDLKTPGREVDEEMLPVNEGTAGENKKIRDKESAGENKEICDKESAGENKEIRDKESADENKEIRDKELVDENKGIHDKESAGKNDANILEAQLQGDSCNSKVEKILGNAKIEKNSSNSKVKKDLDNAKSENNSDNEFLVMARKMLEGVGGKDNVISVDNCVTRLRLELKDVSLVDEKLIKSAGAAGVIRPGKNSVQIVIGTKVQFVADEFSELLDM